jgi:ABC-type Mn2+/Zn2+ transport system permease subunit
MVKIFSPHFLFFIVLRRRILLTLSDREFASALGLKLGFWDVSLALLNGFVIAVAVAVVGPLVTFGFLLLPVMAASVFALSLRSHSGWSVICGVTMGASGFGLSYRYDLPLGASVVMAGCLSLLLAHMAHAVWRRV